MALFRSTFTRNGQTYRVRVVSSGSVCNPTDRAYSVYFEQRESNQFGFAGWTLLDADYGFSFLASAERCAQGHIPETN